jgi:aryl-alcohol dehydrogenase-like predicted oxidoreductase
VRYIEIAHSPLPLSVLCLGTASYGSAIPCADAFRMMDAFVEQGGNVFDTAHVYARWLPNGEGSSERTIGAWIKANDCRQDVVVGTKGCTLNLETRERPDLTPEQITRELSESLDRLQTDYVDIYWLHRDNPAVPVADVLDALAPHVMAGHIRALGASNWTWTRLREAADCARSRGIQGFSASQISWSLAAGTGRPPGDPTTVSMDDETHAYHLASGLSAIPFSAQAGGFFAGKGRALHDRYGDSPPETAPGVRHFSPENVRRVECSEQLARQYGVSPNSIALAYLTSQPFPVSAIIGPRTVEQVVSSCEAADLRLSRQDLAFLDGSSTSGQAREGASERG